MYYNRERIIALVMAIVCVFFLIISVSSFRTMKKSELQFNEKKAVLVKENLDLKDRINALQEIVVQKTEAAGSLEKEKTEISEKLKILKEENDHLLKSYTEKSADLRKKNTVLKKRIASLEASPVVQRLKEAIENETNVSVKKVLEDAVQKVELIKAGKNVTLEPIVVTETQAFPAAPSDETVAAPAGVSETVASALPRGREGMILSVDKKNALIVINLGSKDGIKEGFQCIVVKDNAISAQAEIISVRYRISAAFMNEFKYGSGMDDIKEGMKVVITENQTP